MGKDKKPQIPTKEQARLLLDNGKIGMREFLKLLKQIEKYETKRTKE